MMILLVSESLASYKRWRKALVGEFVLHQVADKRALIHTLREFTPAIAILDYDSKRLGKSSLIREITRISPQSRIIALTDRPTLRGAATVISAGATGYYSKTLTGGLLKKAVQVVSKGELWVSRKDVSALITKLFDLAKSAHSEDHSDKRRDGAADAPTEVTALSGRENEIVTLIGKGLPNKIIAHDLHITEHTVKAHLSAIFRKLNVTNRTELAVNLNKPTFPTAYVPRSFERRLAQLFS
jgi:DNA-binding NarL/FixJ family response regulator